ncbi:MAG: hypothetical protein KDE32_14310 [Novosphingobium sp.]|nr:hypothetical protein [Novosphingobium sp.]
MYALSQPRKAAFIYDPGAGLDIPLVVEFERKAIFVEYPDVSDLEADFTIFPDLASMRDAAKGNRQDIDRTVRVGLEYSRKFADRIRRDDCSFDEITQLILKSEKAKATIDTGTRRRATRNMFLVHHGEKTSLAS